jgi:hypothetical protein
VEAKNITASSATITVSIDELTFMSNTINETLEALDEWEFQTRTGVTLGKARELHSKLIEVLEDARRHGMA